MQGRASGTAKPRLALTTCTTCDILCERRPTVQALEHLLREAQGHIEGGDSIEVTGKRLGGQRSLEIRVKRAPETEMGVRPLASSVSAEGVRPLARPGAFVPHGRGKGSDPLNTDPLPGRLRIILARLLLEVQGAKLTCTVGEDACWTALIEFPGRG